VLVLVADDLIANGSEHQGVRRAVQRLIIYFGDDLRRYEHADRDLQRADDVAKSAKNTIRPTASAARDAIQAHEASEVSSVTALLAD